MQKMNPQQAPSQNESVTTPKSSQKFFLNLAHKYFISPQVYPGGLLHGYG